VGCGNGKEAFYLRRHGDAGTSVTGCDLQLQERLRDRKDAGLTFVECDAQALPFADSSFDYVFSYHMLEHVRDPRAVVSEMSRVLAPRGLLYVGTPNRNRLLGYIGSFRTPLRKRLRWNVNDLRARLHGRFTNEAGAHAGFTTGELEALLRERFTTVDWLTADYLRAKYGGRLPSSLLSLVTRSPLREYLAPSIYALCEAHPERGAQEQRKTQAPGDSA
jgi:SAM-dependent methyltransferase